MSSSVPVLRRLPIIPAAVLALTISAVSAVAAHPTVEPTVGSAQVQGIRSAERAGSASDIGRVPAIAAEQRAEVEQRRLGSGQAVGSIAGSSDWIERAETDTPLPAPRTESTASPAGGSDVSSFGGRNRIWIPDLGIRRSTTAFPCSSKAYPGDRVYRWGCAGRNNLYLFGHAHSVFRPLHDAYVRGTLRKGMTVLYADGQGRVSTFKVSWWKVTTPDKGEFAFAAQSRPSMTLQTCVGAKSQFRLVVRLAKVS